ncbi:MAG: hypothetical protein IJI10_10420 [Eubacterium sp.]|nr:hypothetical protein [Eubacterium sp.]
MNTQERKEWELFLGKLAEEKKETPGEAAIRTDLCLQILRMSKHELFEFCQDIGSIPGLLGKPDLAMDCEMCRKVFGACTAKYGDVDFKNCEERFWRFAETGGMKEKAV